MVKEKESTVQRQIGGVNKLTRMLVPTDAQAGGGMSLGLTLPVDLITKLGWHEKQWVVVKQKANKLIISDWKKKDVKK